MSSRRAATRGAARLGALLHWLDESEVEALTDEHLDWAGQYRDDPTRRAGERTVRRRDPRSKYPLKLPAALRNCAACGGALT
jgi:hypothetical protein